jgi:hypothetical protein
VTIARVLCLLTLLVSTALSQTKILLYDFEARSVDQTVIKTTTQLLRDALNGTYKYVVVDPAQGTECYNVVAAAESARAHGAAQALVGNIMAIGGRQLLTYQLVDAATATVMLQSKVDVPSFEEFPVMADRIAQSIVTRQNYGGTAEPEQMTSTEVEPRIRHPRKPYAGIFLTAGYNFLLKPRTGWGAHAGDTLATDLVNLNLAVSFETQHMLTLMQMGLSRGINSESDINFDLLGNYVIGDGDFAPFVGGGLGINRYSFDLGSGVEHNDGLALSAGGGVLGLRTYYFRLITAGYFNVTKVSNHWGLVPGVKVLFGITTPSMGPDATLKTSPGCVGAAIGTFFLTGLIIALVS